MAKDAADKKRPVGRPRRTRERSSRFVAVAVAPAELAWIDAAAQAAGLTRSEWMRSVALAAAQGQRREAAGKPV